MSKQRYSKSTKSLTDWKRVKREIAKNAPIPYSAEDGPYDPNDAKETAEFLSKAVVRRPGQRGPQKAPTKERVTLRLSRDVVEHYRASGEGWQTRIDETLQKIIRREKRRA